MFSLEMGADEIALRLLCSRARVDQQRLRDGFLDKGKDRDLAHAAKIMKNAPFFVDDSAALTITEIRAKARRMHRKHNLGLIIIDYLQLVNASEAKGSHVADITQDKVDNLNREFQSEHDSLQDRIDRYNISTKISVGV